MSGNALMIFLASGVFCVVGAGVVGSTYPLFGGMLRKVAPARRAHVLLGWCAAPAAFALVLTAVCLAPSVGSLVGLGTDHCLVHDDRHPHLCVLHVAGASLAPAGWGFVFVLSLWWIGTAGPAVLRVFAQTRRLRRLDGLLQQERGRIRIVNSAAPVAFAGGILAGCVYISSALIRRLSPSELRVVVEHEWAHVRRRDGLRKLVASLLCATQLPGVRRRLMADLALACEQACDVEAAARVGDRTEVAEAIVSVERLFVGSLQVPAPGWSFVGGNVPARVEALLHEPERYPSSDPGWVMVLATFGGLALALLEAPLHHETEALVGLLLR